MHLSHDFSMRVLRQGAAVAQIDRCFGFETAVEEAQRALLAAKVRPQISLRLPLYLLRPMQGRTLAHTHPRT